VQGPFEIGRVVRLVGVDEDEVERAEPLGLDFRSVSSAAPILISTMRSRPARATFRRATSACLALRSRLMRRPSSGKARASQMVE
jgi:hypothetical protein